MNKFDQKIKKMLGGNKKNVAQNFGFHVEKMLKDSRTPVLKQPRMSVPFRMQRMPSRQKGASVNMQQRWNRYRGPVKRVLRQRLPDTDNDRVPDIYDCSPRNVMKQDNIFKKTKKYFKTNVLGRFDTSDIDNLDREKSSAYLKYFKHRDIDSDQERVLYGYFDIFDYWNNNPNISGPYDEIVQREWNKLLKALKKYEFNIDHEEEGKIRVLMIAPSGNESESEELIHRFLELNSINDSLFYGVSEERFPYRY